MYILVQHTISDPPEFWNAADPTTLSPKAKLHHTFPTPDGTRATCLWEADTVEGLRNLLEPVVGRVSRNEYMAVENRDGFGFPSRVPRAAATSGTGKR
jgi:hypothetical protein